MANLIIWKGIYLIDDDSHFTPWVKQAGRLDHDSNHTRAISKLIKKGDLAIDAGANIGTVTEIMSKLVGNANKSIQGPLNEITCGVVLAFEPYGLAYRALVKNMEKRKNVITFNMGLGKSNGFARNTIESMPDFKNYGMNSLVPSDEPSSVPVTTIDVIGSNGLSRCNFIKIDVEGLEIEVLEGASNTISKFKPYLDIEVNDYTLKAKGYTREQLFSKLRELGYKWTPYSGNESMEQFDIIATAN